MSELGKRVQLHASGGRGCSLCLRGQERPTDSRQGSWLAQERPSPPHAPLASSPPPHVPTRALLASPPLCASEHLLLELRSWTHSPPASG